VVVDLLLVNDPHRTHEACLGSRSRVIDINPYALLSRMKQSRNYTILKLLAIYSRISPRIDGELRDRILVCTPEIPLPSVAPLNSLDLSISASVNRSTQPTITMSFSSVPILDLSLARCPNTKPQFLQDLRHALLEVGFLYIKNTGIPDELISRVKSAGISFFDLPEHEKLKCQMVNAPSFLGYNKLGMEITRFKTDWREQIDLSTPHPVPSPDDPLYRNLLAPNLWPSEDALPGFKTLYEDYMQRMGDMSMEFTSLIAEAIGLAKDAFAQFFDEAQQHKLKIVKYPDLEELGVEGEAQGVGPHKDSMLTSYLLQASHHRGLQVQNAEGQWVDCPPIDGTFVVAIGQGMEALTQGVCQSTTHRVQSPPRGSGARYSIPFFQGVSYDATFESMDVPESVKKLRADILERRGGQRLDDIEFTFIKGMWSRLGEATLMNRIKSHPDVGERWVSATTTSLSFSADYPAVSGAVEEDSRRSGRGSCQVCRGREGSFDSVDVVTGPAADSRSTLIFTG
jgi:isopenicillin N synthase-like dioxygenase